MYLPDCIALAFTGSDQLLEPAPLTVCTYIIKHGYHFFLNSLTFIFFL